MSHALNTRLVKAFSADITVSEGERAVTAKISTIDVDREGEVLIPRGCDTKDFELNPIVFLGHDYYTLPIAKCVAFKKTDDELIAKTVFASRPDTHPEGEEWVPDTIFALYQQGVMNAFSVGLVPLESRPAVDRDLEKYGAGVRRIISRWKLFEYSAVPLPCNQAAVTMAVAKRYMTPALAKGVFHLDQPMRPKLKYTLNAVAASVKSRERITY